MSGILSQRGALPLLVKPHLQGGEAGGGGQAAVGHLKPRAAGNASERAEGGGREWGAGPRGAGSSCLRRAGGLGGGGSSPRAPAVQPPPAAPPAPANCSEGAPALPARATSPACPPSGFPNVAASQPEPVPSREPLSHLFSRLGFFFFFFLLAAKYLRATWSLVLG